MFILLTCNTCIKQTITLLCNTHQFCNVLYVYTNMLCCRPSKAFMMPLTGMVVNMDAAR